MLKRVGVGEEHVGREGSWRERWMDGKVMEAGPRSVVDNNDRHGCGPVWDGKRGEQGTDGSRTRGVGRWGGGIECGR